MNFLSKKILFGLILVVGFFGLGYFLNQNSGIFSLSPGIAHAQQSGETLYDSLSFPGTTETNWIFNGQPGTVNATRVGVWSILLGLANAFGVIILFFFAFVNIAHIQYDTYQLKKMLPKLIIGLVMANFSMVICRLMVGIANVITVTFVQDTKELANGVMNAMCFPPTGSGFKDALLSNVSLPMIILFGLLVLIAVLIMGFLLWIRKIVIYLLAACSPIAFVLLAFPPTESYFKKWWEWEISWTFMGSIMIFLMWIASKVGASQCQGNPAVFSLTVLLATVGIIYLAAIIPFKLGGPVMGAWGGLGKKAAGLAGKAITRNPWAKAASSRTKANLNRMFNNTGIGRSWRAAEAKEEDYKKARETETKGAQDDARRRRNPREQSELDMRLKVAQDITADVAARVEENINNMEAGTMLQGLTNADVQRLTGHATAQDAASQFVNNAARVNQAKKAIIKRRQLDVFAMSRQRNEANKKVRDAMTANVANDGVDTETYDTTTCQAIPGQLHRATFADLVDDAADWRLNGKKAPQGSQRQQDCFRIAREKEQQTEQIRQNHPDAYDYDAALDRNLSGRQYAEIGEVLGGEIKTEDQNVTGYTVWDGTRATATGQPSVFGTSEMRGTSTNCDNSLRGEWDQNEGFGSDVSLIKRDTAMLKMQQGVRNGDRAGVFCIHDTLNRVAEARAVWSDSGNVDAQGNRLDQRNQVVRVDAQGRDQANSKINNLQDSLAALPVTSNGQPRARRIMEQSIFEQYRDALPPAAQATLGPDFQNLVPGQQEVALRNFDVSRLTPADRGEVGTVHKSFLTNVIGNLEHDQYLRYGESIGTTVSRTPAGGDAHPLSNPHP